MASKKETSRTEETFEFTLAHEDVVDMMNDPDVLIDSGDVDEEQEFQILLRRSNGSEILLRDMTSTDELVFRFRRVTIETDSADFDDTDVS